MAPLLSLLAAVGLLAACSGNPDPCAVEPVLCRAQGGEWVLDELAKCGGRCEMPEPPDPPDPPEPPEPWQCPLEMPECGSVGQTCSDPPTGRCWHNPTQNPEHCEEAPLCEPAPPDPPDPPDPPICRPRPQARIYWLHARVADATPAQCGCQVCDTWEAPDGSHCYEGRYCCPLGCEGDPNRYVREIAYMGGPSPLWRARGGIRVTSPDGWKGKVVGKCTSRPCGVSWCFPNGATCSKWLEFEQ